MADHYTKSKLTITLGMVGSLIRELKAGWRPGPRAAPDLIAIDLKAPPLPEAPEYVSDGEENPDVAGDDDGRDSDESDMAAIAAPMIDFYVQNTSNVLEKLISPDPPKLHARSLHAPDYPACALLRNKGVRIDDMTWAGTFPGTVHAICYHCCRIRPEIEDQLDGYAIAVEQDSEPEKSDIGPRPRRPRPRPRARPAREGPATGSERGGRSVSTLSS